jgi:hypothetical protein
MQPDLGLRVPGADKTVAENVSSVTRTLRSETRIEKLASSRHLLNFIRSPMLANTVLPSHQSPESNKVTTGRYYDDLCQSNDHSSLVSQLRAHGLSLDDRGTSQPQSPIAPYTQYAFVESQQLMSLPSEDVALLTSKDCFSLPNSNSIDEFVREYFKHIHPSVPVLDEAEFWRIYRNDQSTGPKISLFVLQSLLLASCPVSAMMSQQLLPLLD